MCHKYRKFKTLRIKNIYNKTLFFLLFATSVEVMMKNIQRRRIDRDIKNSSFNQYWLSKIDCVIIFYNKGPLTKNVQIS